MWPGRTNPGTLAGWPIVEWRGGDAGVGVRWWIHLFDGDTLVQQSFPAGLTPSL